MTKITPWWSKFGQLIKLHFVVICKTTKNIILTDLKSENISCQGKILKFPEKNMCTPFLVKICFFDRNYATTPYKTIRSKVYKI